MGDHTVVEGGQEALGDGRDRVARVCTTLLGPQAGSQVDDRVGAREAPPQVGDPEMGGAAVDAGGRAGAPPTVAGVPLPGGPPPINMAAMLFPTASTVNCPVGAIVPIPPLSVLVVG